MSGTAEAESHAVLLSYRGGPTLRPRQPFTTPSPLVMDDRETSTSLLSGVPALQQPLCRSTLLRTALVNRERRVSVRTSPIVRRPRPGARGRLCALRFPIAVCFRVSPHAVAQLHTRPRFLSETAFFLVLLSRLVLPTFGLLGLTTGAEEVPLFHGWRVEPANDNNLTRAARHFPPHARLPGSRVVGVWFDQVHGPNTKPTRIVDTPHMVSSSVRGT